MFRCKITDRDTREQLVTDRWETAKGAIRSAVMRAIRGKMGKVTLLLFDGEELFLTAYGEEPIYARYEAFEAYDLLASEGGQFARAGAILVIGRSLGLDDFGFLALTSDRAGAFELLLKSWNSQFSGDQMRLCHTDQDQFYLIRDDVGDEYFRELEVGGVPEKEGFLLSASPFDPGRVNRI